METDRGKLGSTEEPVKLFFLSEFCATVAGFLNRSIKGLVKALAEGAAGIFGGYLERLSQSCPTMLLLSIMGEGRGVPDIGVEMGVLISSIMLMIFSGTLVTSLQVSCHRGSLELISSADCMW